MNKLKSQITVDKLLDLSSDIDLWIKCILVGHIQYFESLNFDLQELTMNYGYDIKSIIGHNLL